MDPRGPMPTAFSLSWSELRRRLAPRRRFRPLAEPLRHSEERRHRREAEETLGAKFDQRRFHDTILAIGSVPLPGLEQHMPQFIAAELASVTRQER